MTALACVLRFLKDDINPPKMQEIKAFKEACSDGEMEAFAESINPNYPNEK